MRCSTGPAPTHIPRMRLVRGHAPAVLLEAREEPHPGLRVEVRSAALHHALRCSFNPSFWPHFLHRDALALAFPEAGTVPCPPRSSGLSPPFKCVELEQVIAASLSSWFPISLGLKPLAVKQEELTKRRERRRRRPAGTVYRPGRRKVHAEGCSSMLTAASSKIGKKRLWQLGCHWLGRESGGTESHSQVILWGG